MNSSHGRKKQPDAVRREVLNRGAMLCATKAVASVSLQEVADAAGVTKGGLLHHFPSKESLVTAIVDELLERFESDIEELASRDPERYGRFTRAYINVTFAMMAETELAHWKALIMILLTEPVLTERWNQWLERKLEEHEETDSSPELQLARYAVDGIWFAGLLGSEPDARETAHARASLMQMTVKP